MCNNYAVQRRKMERLRIKGRRLYLPFDSDEWSETKINPFKNAELEVFPKSRGPVIVRSADGEYEGKMMRWGLPGPPKHGGAPTTNIRNLGSPHWRPLLGFAHRCLVPFTAFSEYEDDTPKGKKTKRWFAPADRDDVFCFAGIWNTWRGDYGSKKAPNVGEHALFSFLTTEPNDVVGPVHAKAMPVILRTEAEWDEWMAAPTNEIAGIQGRALPNEAMEIMSDDEAEQFSGAYLP
jgi:putative SOS response-associated peptidase YedK